ncbi:class I SAM-dependent methyltransferase [Halorutilus salinus]
MKQVLSDPERSKINTVNDEAFYDSPRFVTHADDGFIDRLTDTYGSVLSTGDSVFDAMSSWVSHLPEKNYERVVAHGLNEAELTENEDADESFCQNLNEDRSLPLKDGSFDAVLCALSVQYLQYPGSVFSEFGRVLEDDGVLVVSFTNRMFPRKAVRAWRETDMAGRKDIVRSYCCAGGIEVERVIEDRPETDPFVAVIAHPKI